MRTTVRLDDALYRRLKEQAAREGRTVAAVMEDAIRIGLAAAAESDTFTPARLPTVDGPIEARLASISYGKMLDLLDDDVPADRRRAL